MLSLHKPNSKQQQDEEEGESETSGSRNCSSSEWFEEETVPLWLVRVGLRKMGAHHRGRSRRRRVEPRPTCTTKTALPLTVSSCLRLWLSFLQFFVLLMKSRRTIQELPISVRSSSSSFVSFYFILFIYFNWVCKCDVLGCLLVVCYLMGSVHVYNVS